MLLSDSAELERGVDIRVCEGSHRLT
uniref:Uncharacterized protein n=1 Tax=Anguilla anguilla TaxID=7936 RepID=A0A0E9PWY0_ANGAN